MLLLHYTGLGFSGVARIWREEWHKRHGYNLSHIRQITQSMATMCYKRIRYPFHFFNKKKNKLILITAVRKILNTLFWHERLSSYFYSYKVKRKNKVLEVEGHAPRCPIVGDASNNSHGNVYGAVIMTKVIARVRPVHPMNVDWAPFGRQPSDQASRLGLWVRRKLAAIIHIHHGRCYYYSARRLILILPSREGWKAEST